MHDDRRGADLGRGIEILLQELSARDPDPIVRSGHIEHVRSVNVQGDAGLLCGGLQRCRASLVRNLGPFPGLRVAKEELGQRRVAGLRLGYRIDLVAVAADRELRSSCVPTFDLCGPGRNLSLLLRLESATLDLSGDPRLSSVPRIAEGNAPVLCRHLSTLAARSDNR